MSNLVISPPNLKFIDKHPKKHYIIGIAGFSICHNLTFNLKQIKELFKSYPDFKLFIDLNTLISNNQLPVLKTLLLELNNLPILGICFEDMSVLELSKELKLNIHLYASGAHQITSSNLIQDLAKEGVEGAKISNDITLDDIKQICKDTNARLMFDICKKERLFVSIRPLVDNYLNYINYEPRLTEYHIKNKDISYEIINECNLTFILHHQTLNLIDKINQFKKLNIDYLVINSYRLDNFETIYKSYNLAINDKPYLNPLPKYTGSLYDKPIFKVVE